MAKDILSDRTYACICVLILTNEECQFKVAFFEILTTFSTDGALMCSFFASSYKAQSQASVRFKDFRICRKVEREAIFFLCLLFVLQNSIP